MPIYSPGHRRTILILLLSSVLLITIDLRGNALLDAARSGFDYAFRPFEIAAEVVSKPIVRAWDGVTRVDDLEAENARLRRLIDQQRSDQIAGQNAIIQNRALRAQINLRSLADYQLVSCSTIGASPSNYDQTVEIDCGTLDGLKTGMPVINDAGLVGKITRANPETAMVMLITDPSYHIAVKVVGEQDPEPAAGDEQQGEGPSITTPSGIPVDAIDDVADDLNSTTTSTPASTLPPGVPLPTPTPEGTPEVPAGGVDAGTPVTSSTTTTTTIPLVTRETGSLDGYGPDRLPRVSLIANSPQFSTPREGDAVLTTGGGADLAPPDLPIGQIVNVERRPGTEGLLLEIEPNADLNRLDFLTVVLYQPPTEMPR